MNIKLTKCDKYQIEGTDDIYAIVQRLLLHGKNNVQQKEHFWMIGINQSGYIIYIELIALDAFNTVEIELTNIFRVAVLKNAKHVIAIHNSLSEPLIPSEFAKNITARLIQIGQILNIELVDHLMISPKAYISFKAIGLMDELKKTC
ncbi:hypothetical protein JMI89_10800 [Frischella sp. Ac48]|uniref:DNA repair protein n=1 Tax=Frischella japonica TaxID=2741544 RepID=A0ABR7QZL4_9GAMM|nr:MULTISPECIES: JAB domain-containing protein [Frischella]MBC9131664.1 DNA repair protein [Frischella japonica]MBX4134112.1 hypothetical protein [Frischella sp. Ac48]